MPFDETCEDHSLSYWEQLTLADNWKPELSTNAKSTQTLAMGIFKEINVLRENPVGYQLHFEGYSKIATDELKKFSPNGVNYSWNEGLARAARHFLNE